MQKDDAILEQEARLKNVLSHIKYKLIVMSGKGGVGKSTVAVNVAYGLALQGYKVGVLDIDLHGPNIPKMLGMENEKLVSSAFGFEPVEVAPHLKAMSVAWLLSDPDQPVIWRGPRKTGVIQQFLSEVNWGELDYLIIDAPPGTGDEPLSVCQFIDDLTGAVIVTTPQDVAVLDARKSVSFVRKLDIPIIGIVENMSGFICPHCNKESSLFGSGGGENAALDLNVPFLGRIPIDQTVVQSGDAGRPYIYSQKETPVARSLDVILQGILDHTQDSDA